MATNVVMPKMGESITEGTILRWLKKPGDAVKKDEPILEISTDKVDTEVPAPIAGVLLQQLVQEKETVAVGAPIAVLGESGEKVVDAPTRSSMSNEPKTTAEPIPIKQTQKDQPSKKAATEEQAIVMPKMGESITEGTILRWLKQPGDLVKKDEPLLEISTDKVDTEVPAPFAGTLTRHAANVQDVIAVGAPVGYISTVAAESSKVTAPTVEKSDAPVVSEPKSVQTTAVGGEVIRSSSNRFYSPLVRSISMREGIGQSELDSIPGTGLGGRVNKNDILSYLQTRGSVPAARHTTPVGGMQFNTSLPAPKASSIVFASDSDLVIPMDNIRTKIAEHMIRSQDTSAHVTSVSEVDVTNIVKFREKYKDEFKKREGVSLTYTPIMIEAMVKAIKEFPFVNAAIDGTNVIVKRDINFGVAVSLPPAPNSQLPPALIVPVIKKAQDLNLAGLAKQVSVLADKARNKKLSPDDISGCSFSFTNPGMFGNLFGTPIINQPNVAIITTGAIVKRAVVKTDAEGNDYIAIRSMMFLGLSYDHRIVDGQYGVRFTERVKYYMENYIG